MKNLIRYADVTEYEPHKFSTEASDLNLRPGEWPVSLPTEIGNRQPLLRTSKKVDPDGDLMWVTYRQNLGCVTLRVFND